MLVGLFVCCVGVYGVFKLKYAANRMHAAALNDTLGVSFCLVGLAISAPDGFTALKILLVDNKTVVEQTFNVFARNETDEDGTLTFYIEIVTDRLPDVKPEGDPDSGFDATVDEWGDPIDSEVPMN